jgi:DUF971 family protein
MTNISKFTLNANHDFLEINLKNPSSEQNKPLSFSCEYLRIFAPSECQKAHSGKQATPNKIPQVFHKKNVQLSQIEPLGKHGHRFIFNDGFNDIYSTDHLIKLSETFDANWSLYIKGLSSNNSREESINFKAVT